MKCCYDPRIVALVLVLLGMSPVFAQGEQREALRVIVMPTASEGEKPPVVTALGLQPAGRLLATAGDDHVVRVWEMGNSELVARLEAHEDWVRTAQFSPNGKHLATAGNDRRIYLWDADDFSRYSLLAEHPQAVVALAFSDAGDMLAAVGFEGQLRVYDPSTAEVICTFNCPCVDMRCISFSPDGRYLVGGGRNGRIRVWDLVTQEPVHTWKAHERRIRAVCFVGEGNKFVSASEDRTIRGWDAESGEAWLEIPTGPTKILSMACCSAGCVAVGGSDNSIRIWDLETGEMLERINRHSGSVAALVADKDLLISGSYDTSVRIWQNPISTDDQAVRARLQSTR